MPGQAQTPLKSFGVEGGNLGALVRAAFRLQGVQGVGGEEAKDEAPAPGPLRLGRTHQLWDVSDLVTSGGQRERLWTFGYAANKLSFSDLGHLNCMLCRLNKDGSPPRSLPGDDRAAHGAARQLPAASQPVFPSGGQLQLSGWFLKPCFVFIVSDYPRSKADSFVFQDSESAEGGKAPWKGSINFGLGQTEGVCVRSE